MTTLAKQNYQYYLTQRNMQTKMTFYRNTAAFLVIALLITIGAVLGSSNHTCMAQGVPTTQNVCQTNGGN